MSTDTPARLLRLLSLLQTPREWPGAELAERLGVSRRTVRRDIDRLRELGYPVLAARGATGGYRLTAGKAMPPLLLDDEEAVAIAVGLRAGAGHAVEGVEEASVRALTKLQQILPGRLRHRVSALHGATAPLGAGDAHAVAPETLTTIAAAIVGRERLRFAYRAADGTPSRRIVEPDRLVSTGHRWYLVAYDGDRDDWRSFRVDRLTEPLATGARFVPRQPPSGGAVEYLRASLRLAGAGYRVEAVFDARAEDLARLLPAAYATLDDLPAGGCRLTADTAEPLDWVIHRFAVTGLDFRIEGPAELVAELEKLAGRLNTAAGGGPLRPRPPKATPGAGPHAGAPAGRTPPPGHTP